MSFVRYLVTFICSLLCVLAVVIGGGYFARQYLEQWGQQPVLILSPQEIELSRGMTLPNLAKQLRSKSLVTSDVLFEWWVKLFSTYPNFQAGRYRFENSVTPRDIAQAMQAGTTYEPTLFSLAIPEGFTVEQIAERTEALGICTRDELMRIATSPTFTQELGFSAHSLEGYLFPATYRLTTHPTPEELIQLLTSTFWKSIPEGYEEQLQVLGLTLHQGVTFASLIERETQRDDERSLVSEVIWNRYNKGIALAIDASIIYGIQDYDGNIRRKHLKDKSNPYNTRVHRGLPPGPIGSPGLASLKAVLTPSDQGYFYYVVDADNFSQHRFAYTLREHNKNVADYVRARKKR